MTTDRPDATTITDDQLDALYAELEQVKARVGAVRALASSEAGNPCKWHDHLCPYDILTALDAPSAPTP